MRLRDVVIPKSKIPLGEGPEDYFEVRGLNLNDLLKLALTHFPAMKSLYEGAIAKVKSGDKLTPEDIKEMLKDSIKDSPDFIFRAIASAAGEPDQWEKVAEMPLVVQIEAIEQLLLLSIRSDAEIKKLVEIMLNLIQGTTGMFTKLSAPELLNGMFGKSASA